MRKRRVIWTSLLISLSILGSGGLLAKADGLNASETADSIFRAAQQQQVQQQAQQQAQQQTNHQQYHPATNSSPVRSGNDGSASSSNDNAGLSDNDDDSFDNSSDDDDSPGLSNNDSHSDNSDMPTKSSVNHSTGSHHHEDHSNELTPKQKAEQRAERYLAKVRQRIALRTAQNNDGGAWELRHSYENQLQVIKNGSRTAQTRALQVQLSGELNQLQVAHDKRVDAFNKQINQLPNNHSTDMQAVRLQDAIDYEDANLARRQSQARHKIMKRIRAINPVNKKKALRDAKNDYKRQLREQGLIDPYKLQRENRHLWAHAQKKATEIREDY